MKAKITFLIEVEIELNASLYEESEVDLSTLTPETMLAMEIEIAENDPELYLELDTAMWTITGELIE